MTRLGTVAALARYPVKSTAGEEIDEVRVMPRGLEGDRGWAVCTEDGGIGSGKTIRRFRRVDGLLGLTARTGDGAPVVSAGRADRHGRDAGGRRAGVRGLRSPPAAGA